MEVTMPIIRHPAPAGTYCGTCQSSQCSHAAAGGSTMPRLLTVAALTAAVLIGGAGTAVAGPAGGGEDSQDYRSGYDGPGLVTRTTPHNNRCGGGPSIHVQNTPGLDQNSEQYNEGRRGQGTVCVTEAGAARNGIGSWWTGVAHGPRG